MKTILKASLTLLAFCFGASAMAADRFIIKYKLSESQTAYLTAKREVNEKKARAMVRGLLMEKLPQEKVDALSKTAGVQAKDSHSIATGAHVIILTEHLNKEQAEKFILDVQQDSSVEYIVEDQIVHATSVPPANPNYQWDMGSEGQFLGNQSWSGDNFVNAWNSLISHGYIPGKNVNVAVVDTGYTPHPNFINNLMPLNNVSPNVYGYSFIADCRNAGSCLASLPNANASSNINSQYLLNGLDLGDFISAQDRVNPYFSSYASASSTWHGSHIIGTIVGSGYNGNSSYMTGGAYGALVIPVRVLGKGRGFTSDIINGMSWAAGIDVSNVNNGIPIPINKNPADVINMSLEGSGSNTSPSPCNIAYQDAIDNVVAEGSIVVVAAGNNYSNITNTSPAGCRNVIVVAAKGPTNQLASYSNYGVTTIAASGGDNTIQAPLSEIYSTVWSSVNAYQDTSSGGSGTWTSMHGTSQAVPHVSAAIAAIIGVYKALGKFYTRQDIINILQETATPLNNSCNSGGCATNLALNADAAVQQALALTATSTTSAASSQRGAYTWAGSVIGVVVVIMMI